MNTSKPSDGRRDQRVGAPRSGKGGTSGGQQSRGKPGGGKQGGQRRGEPLNEVETLAGPLAKVLARLPATQRKVLEFRMGLVDGHPHNLTDTARELGLSMHEAKQVEQRAFEHIREAIPVQHLKKLLERMS